MKRLAREVPGCAVLKRVRTIAAMMSGQVQTPPRSKPRSKPSSKQAAERRDRGGAAELSPRARAVKRGVWPIAGCDEAGRGPLAGPVVAAAVILDPDRIPRGIDDSKRLTAGGAREAVRQDLRHRGLCGCRCFARADRPRQYLARIAVGAGARGASAAGHAQARLRRRPRPHRAALRLRGVIGGDGMVVSIAAASIVAKVTRDRLMRALALDCPGYGFEQHKGYAVPEHLEALDRFGPSAHHRSFFAPVIAAREKHQPWTIRREADLFTVDTSTEVGISAANQV